MEHLLQNSPAQTQQILKQPSQKVPSQNLHLSRDTVFKDEQDMHLQGSGAVASKAVHCSSVGGEIWPFEVKVVCEYLGNWWALGNAVCAVETTAGWLHLAPLELPWKRRFSVLSET